MDRCLRAGVSRTLILVISMSEKMNRWNSYQFEEWLFTISCGLLFNNTQN